MSQVLKRKSRRRQGKIRNSLSALIKERIDAISRVARAWLEPSSPWTHRAQVEIPKYGVYSKEMVGACLKSTFTGYHPESLQKWVRRDFTGRLNNKHWKSKAKILIIPPSTVFAATWQAATAVWLAGASVVLKPSRREPVFPRLLEESIHSVVGKSLPIKRGNLNFQNGKWNVDLFDTVVIYGSDATINQLRTLPGMNHRLIGFGSKISIGYIDRKTLNQSKPSHLNNLMRYAAWDATLYDTRGCLSPQCFYVEEGGKFSPKEFAVKLANAMSRLNLSLPPASAGCHGLPPVEECGYLAIVPRSGTTTDWSFGVVSPTRAPPKASARREPKVPRALARGAPLKRCQEDLFNEESFWQCWQFRQSQGLAHIFNHHVIFHRQSYFEPCGIRRVVFVVPIKNVRSFIRHCGEWASHLSTIAVSNSRSLVRFKNEFGLRSGIRFCEIGQMHQPPPWWHNGGINLLRKIRKMIKTK